MGATASRHRHRADALPLLDARSESPRESIVRVYLVRFGLPRPECNLDVFHDGVWVARVDIAWPEALLAVEYDGMGHLDEAQRRRDAWRRNALQRAGWLVITLTADDLRHPELMCRRIAEALAERLPLVDWRPVVGLPAQNPATGLQSTKGWDVAVGEVIVDEAAGLHRGVHRRRPDEDEAIRLEGLAQRRRLGRDGRHVRE